MNKIEAWKTTDDKIWENEDAAKVHQTRIDAKNGVRFIYYNGMIECETDLINFLDQHRHTILNFYGVKEK